MTDFSGGGWSMQINERREAMFTAHVVAVGARQYLAHRPADDPEISPLFGDWSGMPPLRFHAASSEMVLDHSLRGVDRARMRDVDAQAKVWLDLPHVFPLFGFLHEAEACRAEIAAFVSNRLARSSSLVGRIDAMTGARDPGALLR